jgi:hypothetical protein
MFMGFLGAAVTMSVVAVVNTSVRSRRKRKSEDRRLAAVGR